MMPATQPTLPRLSSEQAAKLHQLRANGMTDAAAIAKELSTSPEAVTAFLESYRTDSMRHDATVAPSKQSSAPANLPEGVNPGTITAADIKWVGGSEQAEKETFFKWGMEHQMVQKAVAAQPGQVEARAKLGLEPGPSRGQHADSLGVFETELHIFKDLPKAARFGVFAEPGKVEKGLIRFSNAPGQLEDPDKRDDRTPAVRGIGVTLPEAGKGVGQNLTFTSMPTFFGNPGEVMAMVSAKAQTPGKVQALLSDPQRLQAAAADASNPKLQAAAQAVIAAQTSTEPDPAKKGAAVQAAVEGLGKVVLGGLFVQENVARTGITLPEAAARAQKIFASLAEEMGRPINSLATEYFFNPMTIDMGDGRVARTGLRPLTTELALQGEGKTMLRDDLKNRLAKGDIVYEVVLQFFENEAKTPINDTTDPWPVPVVPVAHLVVKKQDFNPDLQKQAEKFIFGPKFGQLNDPVGQVGRFRAAEAYPKSEEARTAKKCPFAGLKL